MAVELYEVTITADPAYPDTEIGMAELAEARSKRAEHNRSAWLRRKGIIVREREAEHKIRKLPGA